MGCLGKYNCSYHKDPADTFGVIGVYCLDGWRKQAHHYNTFFTYPDGSPFTQIRDEEAWAQEQFVNQLGFEDLEDGE